MAKKLTFILLMSGVMLSPMGTYATDDEDREPLATMVRPCQEIITTTEGFDEKFGPFKETIVNKSRPDGTINITSIKKFPEITSFYMSEYNPHSCRGCITIFHAIDHMFTPTQSINYLIQEQKILEGGEGRVLDPDRQDEGTSNDRHKAWEFLNIAD